VEGGRVSVVESDRFIESAGVPPGIAPRTAVRQLRIALLGYGRVGQAVATLAEAERARLRAEGLRLNFVGALVRDRQKPRSGPAQRLHTAADDLFAEPFDVLIDVMGGVDPAGDLVRRALEAGAHVVTANKTLVAARGLEFDAFARQRGVAFVYDAAVLAGVPFLGALARRPLIGSPRSLTGIINGTSHFIACRLERGGSFDAALAEATKRGYAEPDSSADVGGRDAAEKLTILLHLAGCRDLQVADVTTCGLDAVTPADVFGARAVGGVIKPAALASLDPANPGAWVGPVVVDRAHAFAALDGVQNALELAGSNGDAVTFAGPGAGPRVTAATILDDLVEAATRNNPSSSTIWRTEPVPAVALRQPPASGWYLRASGGDISAADLRLVLSDRQCQSVHVIECGRAVVARTDHTSWVVVADIVKTLRARGRDVLALPILEGRAT
jgi:homoserine dehydrogenase